MTIKILSLAAFLLFEIKVIAQDQNHQTDSTYLCHRLISITDSSSINTQSRWGKVENHSIRIPGIQDTRLSKLQNYGTFKCKPLPDKLFPHHIFVPRDSTPKSIGYFSAAGSFLPIGFHEVKLDNIVNKDHGMIISKVGEMMAPTVVGEHSIKNLQYSGEDWAKNQLNKLSQLKPDSLPLPSAIATLNKQKIFSFQKSRLLPNSLPVNLLKIKSDADVSSLQKFSLVRADQGIPKIQALSKIQNELTSMPDITKETDVSTEIKSVESHDSQLTGEVSSLIKTKGEIQKLDENALEKDVENINQVKSFVSKETSVLNYEKLISKWELDPAYQKEMALNVAKEHTANFFAGNEEKLQSGIQKLSAIKDKYKHFEGVLDMYKKPMNPMKLKSFKERLRPAINLQFQSKQDFLLDFNPELGYRINGSLTSGIGWNERLGVDLKTRHQNSRDHIYGLRVFAQIKIKANTFFKFSPEVMNTLVPASFNSSDPALRRNVWSWMAGMKREFRYGRNVLGNLQVLYNLHNPKNECPYVSKLNVRIGYEFSLNPRKKKN